MPTIALVDDDQNIPTSVSMALEAEGYATVTYTDGCSALVHRFDEIDHMGVGFIFAETTCSLTA